MGAGKEGRRRLMFRAASPMPQGEEREEERMF